MTIAGHLRAEVKNMKRFLFQRYHTYKNEKWEDENNKSADDNHIIIMVIKVKGIDIFLFLYLSFSLSLIFYRSFFLHLSLSLYLFPSLSSRKPLKGEI